MKDRIFTARAPSNIALVKYMGKKDGGLNLPENASLSMTLNELCSWVEVTRTPAAGGSRWVAELPRAHGQKSLAVPRLDEKGMKRCTDFFDRARAAMPDLLKQHGLDAHSDKELEGAYVLRTANTFPEASGIASSASSFAAISLAAAMCSAKDLDAFERAWKTDLALRRALASVSRTGSGSSCRSFEGPFVWWDDVHAHAIQTQMPRMAHFVVLVSRAAKQVSSSEAHRQVKSSPLWDGRIERVSERAQKLKLALQNGDLPAVGWIAWTEAWEMHSLFHTSESPFSYWQPGTIEALQWLAPKLKLESPPIVTLDAGPNVHIIVDARHADRWRATLAEKFGAENILQDGQGDGAAPVRIAT